MGERPSEPLTNPSGPSTSIRCDVTVAVVTPYAPTASETFIRAHVDSLPAHTVLVHGWRPSTGTRPVLSLPSRILYKACRTLGGEGLERETTSAYSKAFRRHHVRAVLAEYGTTGVLTVEACRRVGIPLIVYFHGFDATVRAVLEANAETYPAMFRQAAAIIASSRAIQRKLISLGASAEKVHHISCGVDCRKFAGAAPAAASPVLLAVGRFVEKKAPTLTIRAFAQAHRAHPEARLRMIGDGPLLDECRELAADLAVSQAVMFLGMQPPETIQAEMRRARCFVQHSVEAESGDTEGTPVVILEAAASGLPVISTRHGGIPDVVVEGETGLLVDEKDVQGMAEHMIRLIREPELAAQLGQAARRRAEAHFTMERSLARLWQIIRRCMAEPSSLAELGCPTRGLQP